MKSLLMMSVLFFGGVACSTTGTVQPLEQMSDADYSKWKLYIQLGVQIGADRLLEDGKVTHTELNATAAAIDAIQGETIVSGVQSLIVPALQKAGLKNDEVQLLLVVAEQELISHGALNWINPQTKVLELSPRTKEILGLVSTSLRNAKTEAEKEKAQ